MSIPRAERKEGVCTQGGATLKIVNKSTTLTLPEMNVRVVGIRTAQTLSASTGTEAAQGTFVIVAVTVTNKLRQPVAFDPEQVSLSVGTEDSARTFTSDFDAENMPGDSFVWNDDEIQPGNRKTGTVIFDVAKSSLPRVSTSGNISLTQFSDAGSDSPKRTLGVIRLYK